jgi:hypothetical protein
LIAINAVTALSDKTTVNSFWRVADMGIVLSFPDPAIVFEPDALHGMSVAFDEICEELCLPQCARCERETVAARIIELARRGLIDPRALRERVLWESGLAD